MIKKQEARGESQEPRIKNQDKIRELFIFFLGS